MINEAKVLEVVKTVTDTHAYFFQGTMFLTTEDSKIAVKVFQTLCDEVTPGIVFGKTGDDETFYDFV
jgi:hypothetical protein